MDFKLAALKLMCAQLKQAVKAPSEPNAYTLGGSLLFQRAWLQGVIVSVIQPDTDTDTDEDDKAKIVLPRLLLDDGTGIVELSSVNKEHFNSDWEAGMYVMVVGSCTVRRDDIPLVRIHKIVDLSAFPDREAMWYLEVIEVYTMFYQRFVEEECLDMEE